MEDETGKLCCKDGLLDMSENSLLKTVYQNGGMFCNYTFSEINDRLDGGDL